MTKTSAGILPFRISDRSGIDVFLVHPGGPYWAKKDSGAWSIAKGEVEAGESPLSVANREFEEELGAKPPEGQRIDLGSARQAGGKLVIVWAVEAPSFEVSRIYSNQFEIEWPPRSGVQRSFPEVDRAEWFSSTEAFTKLLKNQVVFLKRLIEILYKSERIDFGE